MTIMTKWKLDMILINLVLMRNHFIKELIRTFKRFFSQQAIFHGRREKFFRLIGLPIISTSGNSFGLSPINCYPNHEKRKNINS